MADIQFWTTADGEPWGVFAWGDVAVTRQECVEAAIQQGYDEDDIEALREPGPLWIRLTDEPDEENRSYMFCAADDPDAERITGIKLL